MGLRKLPPSWTSATDRSPTTAWETRCVSHISDMPGCDSFAFASPRFLLPSSKSRPQIPPKPLVQKSGSTSRGVQYASDDYQRQLRNHDIVCSMSRKGDCWDNAVAESFFSTLKAELVYRTDFVTRSQARTSIFEYIEAFYNGRRRHSFPGYVTPVEYEAAAATKAVAA
jgi:hypothetical protein